MYRVAIESNGHWITIANVLTIIEAEKVVRELKLNPDEKIEIQKWNENKKETKLMEENGLNTLLALCERVLILDRRRMDNYSNSPEVRKNFVETVNVLVATAATLPMLTIDLIEEPHDQSTQDS